MLNKMQIMCFSATKNAESARRFYGDVLGLPLVEDSPFALAFDANGIMLRIQKVQDLVPAKHTSVGWDVPDIRALIGDLGGKGLSFERYQGLVQDDVGIWQSPSGALIAWFRDPDGNTLSLTQWPE